MKTAFARSIAKMTIAELIEKWLELTNWAATHDQTDPVKETVALWTGLVEAAFALRGLASCLACGRVGLPGDGDGVCEQCESDAIDAMFVTN
jgi:hypothetical protein